MSPKENIERLEELIADRKSFLSGNKSDDEIYRKDIQALRETITAIDLRIPRKTKKSPFTGNYVCQNCFASSSSKPKTERLYYCIWCGQALHM